MKRMSEYIKRIIIVEGNTDKFKIEPILSEDVTILSTKGTFAIERFDYLLDEYQSGDHDVYILVDEDESGMELRRELRHELPQAAHIYTDPNFKEAAETPKDVLAQILLEHHFKVVPMYLFLKRR